MYSNFFRAVAGKPDVLAEDRKEGEGIKPVKDTVSEYIKTPSKLVFEGINKFLVDLPAEPEKTFTGEIVADAIDTFTNTLASKLTQTLYEKGLALLSGQDKITPQKCWIYQS